MKKFLTVLLSLVMILTFMPTVAFAGTSYDSVTLEMEFSDGHMGNNADFWSGKSESVGFVKAYWNGDDIVKKEYISDASALSVETISGQEGKLTISEKDKKHLKLSLSSSLSKEAEYWVNYVGKDKGEFSECTIAIMAHSTKQRDFITKVKYNNFKVTASAKGNTITWTPSITSAKPDNYVIYRSTSKDKGYKAIGITDGNAKKYIDKNGITKNKTYYYKVRARVNYSFGEEHSKYSKAVSARAAKTFEKVTAKKHDDKMLKALDTTLLDAYKDFGLSERPTWIYQPTTKSKCVNDLLYSAFTGNYELNIAYDSFEKAEKAVNILGNPETWYDLAYDHCDIGTIGLTISYWNGYYKAQVVQENGLFIVKVKMNADTEKIFAVTCKSNFTM